MKCFVVGVIFFHVASAILEDSNAGPTSRIVGGNAASQGQFPYQVALMLSGSVFCGATWIKTVSTTRITVLTAAHCIDDLSNSQLIRMQVVFGLHDRSDINDIGTVVFKPNALTIHKGYDARTYSNDVATIVINAAPSSVESVSWARPIELTDTTYSEGELGTASGWGTLESGGSSPYLLHYVTKPVLSLSSCMATSYDPSAIDMTMMCCGEAGKDSCQGDSGGPLVTTRGGKTKLIGMVSWGYACGYDGYPGVYADVNYHRDWIVANSGVVSWGYGRGVSGYPGVYADVNYHRDWIVANSG